MGTEMAIKNIYAEREKFIIIGLTGRTGSGCTTVSDILKTDKFEDLCLHEPKTTNFESNEERKYQIIYNYAKEHWTSFISITMTDMIFSFILEKDYDTFNSIYKELFPQGTTPPSLEEIAEEYNSLSRKINTLVNGNTDGSLKIIDFDWNEILEDIGKLKDRIKEILNNFSFQEVSNNSVKASLEALSNELTLPYDDAIKMKRITSIAKKCKYDTSKKYISGYTYFLQEIGNRIRHHGSIEKESSFSGEHMYSLARRANSFIKAIRKKVDGH